MKTIVDIRPPKYVPGMEKPLPDYSERLARRTSCQAEAIIAERLKGDDSSRQAA